MNGELVQMIWLASHGTNYLQTGALHPDDPSVFQFVRAGRFDGPPTRRWARRGWRADRPEQWLRGLREMGATAVGLDAIGQLDNADPTRLPEHVAVAFVGGLSATLVTGDSVAQRWGLQWTVTSGEGAPDNRIWSVLYTGQRDDRCRNLEHSDLETAHGVLAAALEDARAFASSQNLMPWRDVFDRASSLLESESPEIPYHSDLLPEQAGLARRRLMAAAAWAYVFGGMGSWNDIWFDGDTVQYEHVSRSLYQAVMFAIDAAANRAD